MTIIYNKDAADNAVTVENYPWGYTLKTKRKYWIETTKRGDRLCYQTLNPKTDKWCAVKKSTYAGIKVLYEDDQGHIKTYTLNPVWDSKEWLAKFQEIVDVTKLTDAQKAKICEMKTIHHVRKMVDVQIVNTTMMDKEEIAKKDAEQEKITKKLTNYANHVYGKCLVKNNIGG
jgi:hypothetical protein